VGERSARFDDLVAGHHAAVLRICRAVLRDDALAADAAQETFLRLWRGFGTRAATALESPAAWLSRTALSASLDLARRRGLRAWGAVDVDPARMPAREASPQEALERAELGARLERALAELPEGQRTVFRLRHQAELPLAEVAALLGVESSTVKTQFARACLRLSRQLRAFREEEA
jgi:RNA polymerase sigma-70 factor (ECF subfamily)